MAYIIDNRSNVKKLAKESVGRRWERKALAKQDRKNLYRLEANRMDGLAIVVGFLVGLLIFVLFLLMLIWFQGGGQK